MEVEVRERPPIAGLAFPDERRLVPARRPNVPVETIDADVQLAADEPARVRRFPVEDFRPRLRPLELGSKSGPERLGIRRRASVDGFVVDARALTKVLRRRDDARFLEQVVDFGRGHCRPVTYARPEPSARLACGTKREPKRRSSACGECSAEERGTSIERSTAIIGTVIRRLSRRCCASEQPSSWCRAFPAASR